MSYMIEIYYFVPLDDTLKSFIDETMKRSSGTATFKEQSGPKSECLTVEFADSASASGVANEMRSKGIHVEGPVPYPD